MKYNKKANFGSCNENARLGLDFGSCLFVGLLFVPSVLTVFSARLVAYLVHIYCQL